MIGFEERESFVIIRLERPEKMNALSVEMLDSLREAFERVKGMSKACALILTGAGERAFSAGTDISELQHLDGEGARRASLRGQAVCEQIERLRIPVIAAINGLRACALGSYTARFY